VEKNYLYQLMKILLVEDDQDLSHFIKKILENAGHTVTSYGTVKPLVGGEYSWTDDIILLDLMLPDMPGSALIEEAKKQKVHIPILVLSAKHDIDIKTALLNLGADDYLTKPFDSRELLARINALSRRSVDSQFENELALEDLKFFNKQNKIVRGEKEVSLTKKEGELLNFLFLHKGKTVRTQDIMQKVWLGATSFHSNIVQATIYRLRNKVDGGFEKKLLHSVHGIGYKLTNS
jgi:two-component system, OmpR family, response regulator